MSPPVDEGRDAVAREPPLVSQLVFTPADGDARERGLLGFMTFVVADLLRLDSVTLRRTRGGEFVLTFPVKEDRHHLAHPIVRPVSEAVRRALTTDVLTALRLAPGAAEIAADRQEESRP